MNTILETIRKEVRRAMSKAHEVVRRGTLGTGASSDYTAQVQGIDGETWERVEVWQQYGLASRPDTGAEVALIEPDGAGEGAVIVATQDRAHRPSCDAEETVVYGKKATGQPTVRLKPTGQLVAQAGGATPGNVDLTATGSIDLTPGGAGLVNVGGPTAVDFLIKGTTFNSASATVWGLVSSAIGGIGAACTAAGSAWSTLAADPFMAACQPATLAVMTAAGLAMTGAGGVCTAATIGITTYLGLAPTWTATKAKVL